MKKIKIEVIGKHNCCDYDDNIPEIVNDFCKETGIEIDFKVYRAWDISTLEGLPNHISDKLEEIRKGEISNSGFFLNESWISISPHSPQDSVDARNALNKIVQPEKENSLRTKIHGNNIGTQELKACLINILALNDCHIHDLQTFCTTFDKITFFDGRIKELNIQSHVEKISFRGYDIHKLVEVANNHPDIFMHAKLNSKQPESAKIHISQISFIALKMKNIEEKKHPCIITGGCIKSDCTPYISAVDRFGAWGYAANHLNKTCGFLGIMPKDIAQKDAGFFIPPPFAESEKTLLLTCFAGGAVFGKKYSRIGIATGLVKTALNDANGKGFKCVEANPHDPGIARVLEKCGFHRVDWSGGGRNSLRDQAFYRINLTE